MNKKLLIGIIAGVVVIGAVVGGVFLLKGEPKVTCTHNEPSKIEVVTAVPATCQETGLSEGMKCTMCDTMVVPQMVLGTIECIESYWIVDKEATHTEDGKRHTECTMCKKMFNEETLISGNKKLEYVLVGETYQVKGIGTCRDIDIVIPSTYNGLPVTSIDVLAFSGCSSLTSIEIPDSVTSIGSSAFDDCSSLTSIEIPDSVTSIGENAFYCCTSLTSVVIGDSVTSIGEEAFEYCTSLTSIEVDESNAYYKSIDGNLYDKDAKTLIQYATGKEDTTFVIPDPVTSIGDYAFKSCTSLTSIVIPDSVTSIGSSAFDDCSSLTSIEIPDSVTSIGNCAFRDCSSLTSIVIPDSVTSIVNYAFSKCSSLTIYCEATSKPSGWDSSWNSSNCLVVWGYKPE